MEEPGLRASPGSSCLKGEQVAEEVLRSRGLDSSSKEGSATMLWGYVYGV